MPGTTVKRVAIITVAVVFFVLLAGFPIPNPGHSHNSNEATVRDAIKSLLFASAEYRHKIKRVHFLMLNLVPHTNLKNSFAQRIKGDIIEIRSTLQDRNRVKIRKASRYKV